VEPRVTLSDLARRLGVSKTTVSLALRDRLSVSNATRERVKELAVELGYRRDILQAEAAAHRWKNRPRFRGTLAYLNFPRIWGEKYPGRGEEPAARFRGFSRRAELLGYKAEVHDVVTLAHCARVQRTLQNRGIVGLCLGPVYYPEALEAFDWSRFSVVSAHTGFLSPPFHQVRFDWFEAFRTAVTRIVERGYRNIGVALLDSPIAPTSEQFLAASCYFSRLFAKDGVVIHVAFFMSDQNRRDEKFARWFSRFRPDVVVGFNNCFYSCIRPSVFQPDGQVGYVELMARRSDYFDGTGTFEEPERSGSVACDILHGLLEVSERGIPESSQVTLLRLPWREGETLADRSEPAEKIEKEASVPSGRTESDARLPPRPDDADRVIGPWVRQSRSRDQVSLGIAGRRSPPTSSRAEGDASRV
jgi:DNA-binding LacI/PurR family transcriptional regulator